jgi:type I restriction enzyme S subunit
MYPVYGGNGLRGYTDMYTHDGNYVLIGRQGALCGNINYITGKAYISEHAIVVGENELSNIRWLEQVLGKMNLNTYSESSAQPGLAVEKLKRIMLYAPPKGEQTGIGHFFRSLDDAITLYKRKLDKLKELKKLICKRCFRKLGKLFQNYGLPGLLNRGCNGS